MACYNTIIEALTTLIRLKDQPPVNHQLNANWRHERPPAGPNRNGHRRSPHRRPLDRRHASPHPPAGPKLFNHLEFNHTIIDII